MFIYPQEYAQKAKFFALEVEQTWGLFTTKLVKYFD